MGEPGRPGSSGCVGFAKGLAFRSATAGKGGSKVQRIGYRHQRTLATSTEIVGPGMVTGAKIRVKMHPAPENTGVVFVRTDLPGTPVVPARADVVTSTQRRTTLGGGDSAVTLVEHLLATLAGLRVDNCILELDGPEPPGLDGSAAGFVEVINKAGFELQSGRRAIWTVKEPVTLSQAGATVTFHPLPEGAPADLTASYLLDYGHDSDIPKQSHTMIVTPESFAGEVANCRTFVLEREALMLRAVGVGKHLTARDLLVFGPKGLIDNTLRHGNEPARHKTLDLIGDLSLCRVDLAGHVVAYRSGHSLNVAMAKNLIAQARDAGAELPPLSPQILDRPSFPGRRRTG